MSWLSRFRQAWHGANAEADRARAEYQRVKRVLAPLTRGKRTIWIYDPINQSVWSDPGLTMLLLDEATAADGDTGHEAGG